MCLQTVRDSFSNEIGPVGHVLGMELSEQRLDPA